MQAESKPLAGSWAITLAKMLAIVVTIVLANIWASHIIDRLEIQIWPQYLEFVDRAVLIGFGLYIVLMATPFLPGIEIGLAMMLLLGPKGVLLAYAGTLIALTISFGIGRVFPGRAVVALLRWLHLTRAAALLARFDATPPEQRLEFLIERTSGRATPALLKRRHLLLAVLLNLPGNALLGGGGGIAMMAGMSRLYSFPVYLLLIAVAILPGPVIVLLTKYLQ